MQLNWDTIKSFVEAFGWTKGVFTIFFFGAHWWLHEQYTGRLNDRQKEIDRIAAENKEYRDRLTALLDEHFKLKIPKPKPRQIQKRPGGNP